MRRLASRSAGIAVAAYSVPGYEAFGYPSRWSRGRGPSQPRHGKEQPRGVAAGSLSFWVRRHRGRREGGHSGGLLTVSLETGWKWSRRN